MADPVYIPPAPLPKSPTLGPINSTPEQGPTESGPLTAIGTTIFGQGAAGFFQGAEQAAGNVLQANIAPIKIVTDIAERIPTGWLPGGSDEQFEQIGRALESTDREKHAEWALKKAEAEQDKLAGGNMKADYVNAYREEQDRASYQGLGGPQAITAGMGFGGQGSLGSMFAHSIVGYLGIQSAYVQRALAGSGAGGSIEAVIQSELDWLGGVVKRHPDLGSILPAAIAVKETWGQNRIQELQERLRTDPESLSAPEREAAEAVESGQRSPDHAIDILVRENQSYSDDFIVQMAGVMVTDPLMYESLGAGAISGVGRAGAELAASGLKPVTAFQRAQAAVHFVQEDALLGKIARAGRFTIDPLAASFGTKEETGKALIKLGDDTAVGAYSRAIGRDNVEGLMNLAKEAGIEDEMRVAIRNAAKDQQDALITREWRATQMGRDLGPEMVETSPDDLAALGSGGVDANFIDRLTDEMAKNMQATLTPSELDDLAGRAAKMLGQDKSTWVARIEKMNPKLRAGLHYVTYKHVEPDFVNALSEAQGLAHAAPGFNPERGIPLKNAALEASTSLDRVGVEELIADVKAGSDIGEQAEIWNIAARRHRVIADIGIASGESEVQIADLLRRLEQAVDDGRIMRSMTAEELAEPAMRPIRDFLDRNTIEGRPLWRVGFKPDDEVAMGLKQDPVTGRYVVDRNPTLTHNVDAPQLPDTDNTIKNIMNQIIGSKAGRPVKAFDRWVKSGRDSISAARKTIEIRQNFQRAMVEQIGVPEQIADDLYAIVAKHAKLGEIRIGGIRIQEGNSLWNDVKAAIPKGLRTKAGTDLDVREVLQQAVYSANGDMRIMGLGNKIASGTRNALIRNGIDHGNVMGQITVDVYNKMRYILNPSFYIQRITDIAWFRGLMGARPVGVTLPGTEAVSEWARSTTTSLVGTRQIEDVVMAMTGTWRDTAVDMVEFIPRSTLSAELRRQVGEAVGGEVGLRKSLEGIRTATNDFIANNMTAELHSRIGAVVKRILDTDLEVAISGLDPALQAEMKAEIPKIRAWFDDMRQMESARLGRPITDEEMGETYVRSQIMSARRMRPGTNGLPDATALLHESHWTSPNNFGEMQTIHPNDLAASLGFKDAADLRQQMRPIIDPATGFSRPAPVSVAGLVQRMEQMGLHQDVIARAKSYFGGTWKGYWERLELPLEQGGLDLSARSAKPAQDVIVRLAREAGMDPWEYLSGVMLTNMKGDIAGVDRHVADLMRFLQTAESGADPTKALIKLWSAQLQPSAHETLIREFVSGKTPKPAEVHPLLRRLAEAIDRGSEREIALAQAALDDLPASEQAAIQQALKEGQSMLEAQAARHAVEDAAAGADIQAAYDAGDVTLGQQLNREVAAARGGTAESGGAIKAADTVPSDYDLWADGMQAGLAERVASKKPHPNPDVESLYRSYRRHVTNLAKQAPASTRKMLHALVDGIPEQGATNFSRSEALLQQLVVYKIKEQMDDIYMLAEMGTSRSSFMQSLNHPLFGMYPASYMWSKVIPQTAKILAKNPFALTYGILDVQRAIAIQREFDPEFESDMSNVDRSALAFTLGYATPSLPWEPMEARTSPLARELGRFVTTGEADPWGTLEKTLHQISPERWMMIFEPLKELDEFVVQPALGAAQQEGLEQIAEPTEPVPSFGPITVRGPVSGAELGPVLAGEMNDLQRVLSTLK